MRSPNQRAAPIAMKIGATAPMIVALAMVVRRNAPNVMEMSAAKNTPPSAHARTVSHRSRRPVEVQRREVDHDAAPQPPGDDRQGRQVDLVHHQRRQAPDERGVGHGEDAEGAARRLHAGGGGGHPCRTVRDDRVLGPVRRSDVGGERVAGVRVAHLEPGPEPLDALIGRAVRPGLGVDPARWPPSGSGRRRPRRRRRSPPRGRRPRGRPRPAPRGPRRRRSSPPAAPGGSTGRCGARGRRSPAAGPRRRCPAGSARGGRPRAR